jgi:polysaccharide chain length determinant protein (PEP-CTERM system associated)
MPEELDTLSANWEEYLAIFLRRRRWILIPLFACWAVVWGLSWLLPTSYQSEALILLEQQKVPDQYVVPNVTINLQDRLQSLKQQVFSRTRLQATIDRFHLYPPTHGLSRFFKSGDPIDQMRSDMKLELVQSLGRPGEFAAFKIYYAAPSPQLAQKVNEELTALFVEENSRAQKQFSENTTAFLASQLADSRARMEEQEAKVAAFKAQHIGDLPGQLEGNVQILAGLQAQLQTTQQALDSARQQGTYLQSLLQQYQMRETNSPGEAAGETATQSLDKELADLRLRLEGLQSRYTEGHPDVVALKASIAKTEQLKAKLETETPPAQSSGARTNLRGESDAQTLSKDAPASVIQAQSQLKANQLEIQNYQQHAKELESQIAGYQARLNSMPETELALTAISRGYEESKSNYNSLLQKQMQSQLATSLEQHQEGEQFRVIDPAGLPAKPSAPNHLLISLGGMIFGGVIGLSLAILLELTDVRVRKEKDFQGIVPAEILVAIPRLSVPKEERAQLVGHWVEIGVAVMMGVLMAAGNFVALYRG